MKDTGAKADLIGAMTLYIDTLGMPCGSFASIVKKCPAHLGCCTTLYLTFPLPHWRLADDMALAQLLSKVNCSHSLLLHRAVIVYVPRVPFKLVLHARPTYQYFMRAPVLHVHCLNAKLHAHPISVLRAHPIWLLGAHIILIPLP